MASSARKIAAARRCGRRSASRGGCGDQAAVRSRSRGRRPPAGRARRRERPERGRRRRRRPPAPDGAAAAALERGRPRSSRRRRLQRGDERPPALAGRGVERVALVGGGADGAVAGAVGVVGQPGARRAPSAAPRESGRRRTARTPHQREAPCGVRPGASRPAPRTMAHHGGARASSPARRPGPRRRAGAPAGRRPRGRGRAGVAGSRASTGRVGGRAQAVLRPGAEDVVRVVQEVARDRSALEAAGPGEEEVAEARSSRRRCARSRTTGAATPPSARRPPRRPALADGALGPRSQALQEEHVGAREVAPNAPCGSR